MTNAKFGPGGNGAWFKRDGGKSTVEAPAWLKGKGLDAYEFEAGRGIMTGEATLRQIGDRARENGILMSLHTQYFISLSSVEEEKRVKSIDYIKTSLWAADLIGADTIVIHSGSAGKISREEAMRLSCNTLEMLIDTLGDSYPDIRLGIETMGKQNQLGTLEEVIAQCRTHPRFHPVVDFGHLNARVCGGLFPDRDSYRRIFDTVANALGDTYAQTMHCHFSKIEFTGAGEKKHLTFADNTFGPAFEPLMEAIVAEGLSPRIICESDDTMAEDALAMKAYWQSLQA